MPLPSTRAQKARKLASARKIWGAIPLVLMFVLLLGVIVISVTTSGRGSSKSITRSVPSGSERNHLAVASARSEPFVSLTNGTEFIWQIPESPKAVLFIAHGCHCRAANFWDRSPACPHCVGLPEDRIIVLRALERNFAVIAVSSSGRCWSMENDSGIVKRIIEWWIRKHKLEKLPVMALGASSGGYFVSALANEMRFSSITLMISSGVFDSRGVPAGYPPTLFVHMPKDLRINKIIEKNIEALRKKGVDVKEVRCKEFPLNPTLLSDRISGLDQAFSATLFELFLEKGFIDEKGYLKNDGRAIRWKQALKEREPSSEKYEWLDHIQEELNLAFAYHEMTSLPIKDILDWFESHMEPLAVS